MLILAGVTIALLNEAGILKNSESAADKYEITDEQDVISVAFSTVFANSALNDKEIIPDDLHQELEKTTRETSVWQDDDDENLFHVQFAKTGNNHTVDITNGRIDYIGKYSEKKEETLKDVTITLVPDKTQLTKENVNVTITTKIPKIEPLNTNEYEFYYKIGTGEWTRYEGQKTESETLKTYTETVEITQNTTITARVKYIGKNKGTSLTIENIDKLPPLPIKTNLTKTTKSITITASTTDAPANAGNACSGLAGYSFSKDGGENWSPYQASGTYTFDQLIQGTTYKIKVKAKDKVGNETTETQNAGTNPIEVPTEQITGKITFGNIAWTREKATVIVNVDKLQTGCQLQYRAGETGTWKNIVSGNPTELVPSGTKVYARIWDGVNEGPGKSYASITIIDNTPPTAPTVNLNGYTSGTWTKQNVKVTLSSTDTQSGVQKYQWSKDNGATWADFNDDTERNEASYDIIYRAVDWVGNISANSAVIKIRIDRTAPTKVTVDMHGYANGSWTNQNIQWTYHSTDAGSGIDHYEWSSDKANVGGNNSGVSNFSTDCNTGPIYWRAVDKVGNIGEWSDACYRRIDKTKPVVTTATATTESITFTATDNRGVTAYAITTTNTAPSTDWQAVTSTTSYTTTVNKKIHNSTYYIWAKDVAGNISVSKSVKTGKVPDVTTANLWVSARNWSGINCTVTWATNTSFQIQVSNTPTVESSWKTQNSLAVETCYTTYARLFDGTNHSNYASDTPILKYTVAYNGNGNTSGSTASSSHDYGTDKKLTANGFTKTGHTFKNWNTKADGTGTSYTNGQSVKNLASTNGSTVTLYAQWTVNKYTFTLGSATGVSTTGSSGTGQYNYGSTITLKASASSGYTFSKWTSSNTNLVANPSGANTTFTMPAGNITMTPSATANSYKLTVETGGSVMHHYDDWNTTGASLEKTFTYGQKNRFFSESGDRCPGNTGFYLSGGGTPTKSGYIFDGWKVTSGSGTITKEACGLNSHTHPVWVYDGSCAGDVTITAQWKKTYTLTYNANGGSGGPGSQTVAERSTVNLNFSSLPTRTGYTFKGWGYYPSYPLTTNMKLYTSGVTFTMPSNDVTLYAEWEAIKVTGITLSASPTSTSGTTLQLTATVTPSDAVNKNVTWSSSDTSIATVNASGKVTRHKQGVATITATAADGSGVSESVEIHIDKETSTQKCTGNVMEIKHKGGDSWSTCTLYCTVCGTAGGSLPGKNGCSNSNWQHSETFVRACDYSTSKTTWNMYVRTKLHVDR